MNSEFSKFNHYVANSIIVNNNFNITTVTSIQSLNSRYFIKEEYPMIENLIEQDDIEGIKTLPNSIKQTDEFIDIMIFTDQNFTNYYVTVYDSTLLEQDPQVIKIYRRKE
jgi:hypothetical protein